MNLKATKIGGSGILTALVIICLSTFLIAAFTWSSQTTAFKNPQEISLGTPSVNEWNAAQFFKESVDYDITMKANYNFHSGASITYYIKVIASAIQGTIELGDFSLSISGVTATLSESSAGVWVSTPISVIKNNPDDDITITITPSVNALDLGMVSFEISAQSSA